MKLTTIGLLATLTAAQTLKTATMDIDFTDQTGFTGKVNYYLKTADDATSQFHGNCMINGLDISGWS